MNALKLVTETELNPISQLKTVKAQLKTLQAYETALKQEINDLLDESGQEELLIGDDKVKRSMSERQIFDSKTFESLHPDLYGQFKKSTTVITLRTL